MELKLGRSFIKTLENRVEGFEFEVGIIADKPHKDPVETPLHSKPQLSNYAGGSVRKTSSKVGPKSTGEVFVDVQTRLNINLLWLPFQDRNADIIKFMNEFLKLALKKPGVSTKRVENLLQAIVRNPILRQDYGPNKPHTADAKGFDRHLFDTGQMFKAIIARVKSRV